jgi:methylated-DNA-[protein]-cysteine S-methyltransferase
MLDGPVPAEEAIPAAERVLFPSPIGVIGIEIRGETITRVEVVPVGKRRSGYTPLADLKLSDSTDLIEEVVGRFSEYFAGARRRLGLPYDLGSQELDAFERRVLKQTARTPYGRTRTHQDIAAAVGRPDGYRQVLAVLVANPLPILVPCHRIVPSKAGAGSWVAATSKKEWLLQMEATSGATGQDDGPGN